MRSSPEREVYEPVKSDTVLPTAVTFLLKGAVLLECHDMEMGLTNFLHASTGVQWKNSYILAVRAMKELIWHCLEAMMK